MRGVLPGLLTIAGRGCVAVLALALVLHGSTKRPPVRRTAAPASPAVRTAPSVAPVPGIADPPAAPPGMCAATNWWRRGAFSDWRRVDFPPGWSFPWGTNRLNSAALLACGEIRPLGDPAPVASAGGPLALAPLESVLWYGPTPSNTFAFVWRGSLAGRDRSRPADARIELFRNGDAVVSTNGVARRIPRALPFAHDGFGQDADWVRANFTNAEEILSVGYPGWVDAQVGAGVRNGLYRFEAAFPDDPPEATRLFVGDFSVCVTNAGAYAFVLEKGREYRFGTEPHDGTVRYAVRDDVGGASRSAAQSAAQTAAPGVWTVGGGTRRLTLPGSRSPGCVLWMPTLRGSPDVAHLGPGALPLTFEAMLADAPPGLPVFYRWTTDDPDLVVSDPSARTVRVAPVALPDWREATLSVTAMAGTNALTSALRLTYGRSRHPQARLSLSAPHGVFERGALGRLSVGFSSDVPTNGTLRLDGFARSGEVRLWADPGQSVPVHLPLAWDAADFTGFGCFVEGVSVCSNLDDVVFALAYDDGRGATSRVERAMTCARVARVELESEAAGVSATPPPFDGQVSNPFDERRSPVPDRHLPVFFGTVRDGEGVRDFAVDIRLVISPSGYREPGAEARWFRLGRTPESGDLLPVSDVAAEFMNPKVGGVYRIGAVYGGSPTNECVVVLPLAGASVDAMVRRNLSAADLVVERIKKKYRPRERTYLKNGRRWFWSYGAGDFHGRPDNARSPTVWVYNQVNERTGMGAVATWGGLPIRVAKLSNFWFGYVGTRLEVPYYRLWLAQSFGTSNDESAALSWRAGRELALEGDYGTVVSNLVREAFTKSDGKNVRLWPNLLPLDNEVNSTSNRNFNTGFSAPGLINFSDGEL